MRPCLGRPTLPCPSSWQRADLPHNPPTLPTPAAPLVTGQEYVMNANGPCAVRDNSSWMVCPFNGTGLSANETYQVSCSTRPGTGCGDTPRRAERAQSCLAATAACRPGLSSTPRLPCRAAVLPERRRGDRQARHAQRLHHHQEQDDRHVLQVSGRLGHCTCLALGADAASQQGEHARCGRGRPRAALSGLLASRPALITAPTHLHPLAQRLQLQRHRAVH